MNNGRSLTAFSHILDYADNARFFAVFESDGCRNLSLAFLRNSPFLLASLGFGAGLDSEGELNFNL
jgi:hypothetical protein